jgi:hypothetical protein
MWWVQNLKCRPTKQHVIFLLRPINKPLSLCSSRYYTIYVSNRINFGNFNFPNIVQCYQNRKQFSFPNTIERYQTTKQYECVKDSHLNNDYISNYLYKILKIWAHNVIHNQHNGGSMCARYCISQTAICITGASNDSVYSIYTTGEAHANNFTQIYPSYMVSQV